ncbi:hypothetical protein DNTS_011845 [Danionella cerebrum]|uniref:Uncharacterized protein n=1 Tax=Danionella cerebrum TaxID=2873325 RepID=A0A553MWE4_9TELE|nr:hypothetical protein DNTS_011845 [Danionella translucida]
MNWDDGSVCGNKGQSDMAFRLQRCPGPSLRGAKSAADVTSNSRIMLLDKTHPPAASLTSVSLTFSAKATGKNNASLDARWTAPGPEGSVSAGFDPDLKLCLPDTHCVLKQQKKCDLKPISSPIYQRWSTHMVLKEPNKLS